MVFTLTSFRLCPYAQMTQFAAQQLDIDIDINYININQPPEWFTQLSPTGQVPLLQADDEVIFDSKTIIEFLDDIADKSLHPTNLIQKAKNRAWMTFAMELFTDLFKIIQADNQQNYQKIKQNLVKKLEKFAQFHSEVSLFNQQDFSLVEIGLSPFLIRLNWLNKWTNNALDVMPAPLKNWQTNILNQPLVQQVITENDIEDIYLSMIENSGGYLSNLLIDE